MKNPKVVVFRPDRDLVPGAYFRSRRKTPALVFFHRAVWVALLSHPGDRAF